MKWDILILVPKVNDHLLSFYPFIFFFCRLGSNVCRSWPFLVCCNTGTIGLWNRLNLNRYFDTWVFNKFYGYFIFIPILPLQIAFTFLVYPALILAYMGQAAYLSRHHKIDDQIGYYVSVPGIHL